MMRKQWIAVVVAVIGVSMSALGLAAQGPGPMGAGAAGGNTKQSSKAPSSATQSASDNAAPHARRSLNPITWIKKDSNKGAKQQPAKAKTEKAKTTKAKATKSSVKQAANDDPTPRARRSYNPINWFKKDRNKTTDKSKKANNKKPAGKSTTSEAPARPVDA